MCGIIACITRGNEKIDYSYIQNKLIHRGPDYQGGFIDKYEDKSINLMHNRLSIRDLSNSGNQPYEYKEYVLIFNGEIYNSEELALKLKALDINLKSNCDTEILCKYLVHFGIHSLTNVRGMYAFCFYNRSTKILVAARDQLGIKPLFYQYENNKIIFSSESSIYEKDMIDIDSFESYMIFGYFPRNKSLLKNVYKLRPGEIQIVDINLFTFRKLSLDFKYERQFNENLNHKVKTIVESSISEQLVSDVPIGVFLSGGIDSSLIAYNTFKEISNFKCYVSKYYGEDSDKFNEDFKYASLLSKKLGLNLISVDVDPNHKDFSDHFFEWASKLDEPQANLTGYTSYLLFKQAKHDGTKVILTGDGSDEIFGGYIRYKNALILEKYKFLRFIPKYSEFYSSNKNLKYARAMGLFKQNLLQKICMPNLEFRDYIDHSFFKNDFVIANLINDFDLKLWLSEESNMRVDRASMLNSIEARVPFQDIRIVENFFKFPLNKKFDNINKKLENSFSKKQLRKYASSVLPEEIIKRRKMGWDAPDSKWFRSGLRDLSYYFIVEYDSGFFNKEILKKLYYSHINKKSYQRNLLRRVLMFNIWHKEIYKSKK